MNLRALEVKDFAPIQAFEKQVYLAKYEPMQAEMQAWSAPWRTEALEYYQEVGWSMVIESDQEPVAGYFLAQAKAFVMGRTQVLWIEWLSAKGPQQKHLNESCKGEPAKENSIEAGDIYARLVDTIYRLAKTKHLQGVFFFEPPQGAEPFIKSLGGVAFGDKSYFLGTSK